MNAEVKKKFVGALRSGKYEQIRFQLRRGDCFCALGVLCDLYINEFPDKAKWNSDGHVSVKTEHGYIDQFTDGLPQQIADWAEIDNYGKFHRSICGINFSSSSIIDKNDSEQKTFKEIANIIDSRFTKI